MERQQADCRALCTRLGYEVVDVFVENDTGASTRSRKPRPLYAELIEGARSGRWSVIVAYSSSRLTRRPLEGEALITLFERQGAQFAYVVSSRFDLATADGRMQAGIAASIDAGEAERIAERVGAAKAQAATDGRYRGGMRRYGYEADGVTVRPSEAAVVKEATSAVLAGRSLSAVAAELNERGAHTSTGNQWTSTLFRDVLIPPRNAALIGRGKGAHLEIVGPAQWSAVVDEPAGWAASPGRRALRTAAVWVCCRRSARTRNTMTAPRRAWSCRRSPRTSRRGGSVACGVDVAAVHSDEQWQVRARQRGPVGGAAGDESRSFVAEFVLQTLRGGLHLPPHRGGVQRPAERQDFVEVGGQPVETGPAKRACR